MADKTMHHVVIGDDTFELIDEAGREETTALKEDLSESVGDLKSALLAENRLENRLAFDAFGTFSNKKMSVDVSNGIISIDDNNFGSSVLLELKNPLNQITGYTAVTKYLTLLAGHTYKLRTIPISGIFTGIGDSIRCMICSGESSADYSVKADGEEITFKYDTDTTVSLVLYIRYETTAAVTFQYALEDITELISLDNREQVNAISADVDNIEDVIYAENKINKRIASDAYGTFSNNKAKVSVKDGIIRVADDNYGNSILLELQKPLHQISDYASATKDITCLAGHIYRLRTIPVSGTFPDISAAIYCGIASGAGYADYYAKAGGAEITFAYDSDTNVSLVLYIQYERILDVVFQYSLEDITPSASASELSYQYATLLTGYNCYINYDTVNGTITIPRDTIYIDYLADGIANYKVLNSESETVISDLSRFGTSAIKLIINVSTWEFTIVSYQTPLTDNQQLVATVRLKGGNHVGSLSTPTPWSVDGYPYGIILPNIENFTQKTGTIKSINHRGFNTVAPENTLPAFKLSRLNGFEYVETDIQFTSDGVPVCLHDLSINRTARNADGTTISSTINISDITYEQALDYVFCYDKYSAYPTVKIPTYVEFINLCKAIGLKPYIELKSDAAYTQEQITGLVSTAKRNGMTDSITWISSSTVFLGYVKTADANARLGVISGVAVSATIVSTIEALRTGTNEVFLDIDNSVLTSEGIATCYSNNIPVEVWTVNTESTINGLDAYITGVTSDSKVASDILYASNITFED